MAKFNYYCVNFSTTNLNPLLFKHFQTTDVKNTVQGFAESLCNRPKTVPYLEVVVVVVGRNNRPEPHYQNPFRLTGAFLLQRGVEAVK